MEKLYARDVYGKTLIELGQKDPRVVVFDADLSGSTRTILFAKEFPDRFFNFGVAEQNMMATAGGMASCGKIVFASTFAMFASARATDQVRNTICYNNLNVKIVATHGGISVGEDGASHQALEDVYIMRAIPNMHVIVPSDAWEARAAVLAAHKTEGPFYIRLGRSKVMTLDNKKDFHLGKGYLMEEGDAAAVIACGIMVEEALKAREILKKEGITVAVYNFPTIKPIDEELIAKIAAKHKKIITCEEHQITGGLYSAVCEVTARRCPVTVMPIGVDNRYGQSGPLDELMVCYGLAADCVAKKIQHLLRP